MSSRVTLSRHEKVFIGGFGALMPVAANLFIVANLTYAKADTLPNKAIASGAPHRHEPFGLSRVSNSPHGDTGHARPQRRR